MSTPETAAPDVDRLNAQMSSQLFRALSDPTRIQLLCRLIGGAGPQTVTEVSSCCGVHLSGVSRHLAVLREAGVVRAEKEGREVRYSPETQRITSVLRGMADAITECAANCGVNRSNGVEPSCCPSPEKLENES